MSRIHDRLRRGRAAAGPSAPPRSAHTDVVLATLGYRRGRRSSAAVRVVWTFITLLAILMCGYVGWLVLMPNRPAPAAAAAAPRANTPAATAAPTPVQRPPTAPAAASIRVSPSSAAGAASPPRDIGLYPHTAPPGEAVAPHGMKSAAVSTLEPPRQRETAAPTSAPPGRPVAPAGVPTAPPATRAAPPLEETAAVVPAPAVIQARDDFELGLYYQRAGEFDQALVHYKAVLQRDELNVEAHNNLGLLYKDKGLLDDAVREFQRALFIDPRYARAHVNLGATYLQLKRPDQGAAEFRAALALEPRNADAIVNLALAQTAAGQPADARGTLLRALTVDPRSAAAHYNLALEYEQEGEISRAVDHYRAFLQFAGPAYAGLAPDVRARIDALVWRLKQSGSSL